MSDTKPRLHLWVIRSELTKIRAPGVAKLVSILGEAFEACAHYVDGHEPGALGDAASRVATTAKCGVERFDALQRVLTTRNLSNALKHCDALSGIAASRDTHHLVVEDDVVYGENVVSMLGRLVGALPADYEMVMTGLPYGSGAKDDTCRLESFANVYNVSPSCDSYLITPAGAKALLPHMLPLRFATNVQLSYAMHKASSDVLVAVPNVFLDGSKLGSHIGTVEINSPLIYNPAFHRLKSLLSDAASLDADVEAAISAVRFERHPEIAALFARYHIRKKRFAQAIELFTDAYRVLSSNNAPINGTSEFLRQYIDAFRYVQPDVVSP